MTCYIQSHVRHKLLTTGDTLLTCFLELLSEPCDCQVLRCGRWHAALVGVWCCIERVGLLRNVHQCPASVRDWCHWRVRWPGLWAGHDALERIHCLSVWVSSEAWGGVPVTSVTSISTRPACSLLCLVGDVAMWLSSDVSQWLITHDAPSSLWRLVISLWPIHYTGNDSAATTTTVQQVALVM